jgi:tetratricopeptide (TPR) repeat protein
MIEGPASSTSAAEPPPATQGRYRVESELARGSMGAVYRAFDTVTQRPIALKRSLSADPRYLRMFEREYHTLVGLKHPRIIEVYEYGVDEAGAYYTMELLQGRDLRALAPLDYRVAARYLRDVASSLGLLHARRLLHRDLSPRNVHVSDQGRCKLIDFGALSGFGVPDLVVGTPPFVPPESLHGLALDQRADLYALGAVAYVVLTGRHAYRARSLEALPMLWKQAPPRPSKVVAELGNDKLSKIPPELDDLVMSLLTLDPLGRPASAAEVIDRLTLIADLPRDEEASAAASSYLVGVPTVGRAREQRKLRDKLEQSKDGHGAHVVIEARAGMGSTRLLHDLVVDAQLAGALPLLVDAAVSSGPFGAAHSLTEKLLITAREHTLRALQGHEAVLARFSPPLQAAFAATPDQTDFSLTPGELRQRVLAALSDGIARMCQERCLVIAIDNAHRLDDASAALLSALASDAIAKRLLLVMSVDPEQLDNPPPALRASLQGGTRIHLHALTRPDVALLVHSWFGGAEHSERLSALLYRVTGGNARACVELTEHLVRNRIVRDIQGAWVLPFALGEEELPSTVHAVQVARVESLPEPERKLAEALSVHRGRLPLELCLEIAQAERIQDPFAVIEALARENVLTSSGNSYAFSYDALREALIASLPDARKRELHLRMGRSLVERGDGSLASQLDAGWHLLHGGERERGASLLAAAGIKVGYTADDMVSAVPALRAALDVFREGQHDDYDRVPLLGLLATAGFFSDRRLADEFGPEAVETFERVLGLTRQRWLARFLGQRLAFFVSIAIAAVRFTLRRGSGGIPGFRQLIVQFVSCVTVLTATAAVCLDSKAALAWAERIAPLRNLGDDAAPAYAYRFALLLAAAPRERVSESLREAERLLERLDDPRPIFELPENARNELQSGILRLLGMMELFCVGSRTPELAERLDQTGRIDHRAVADQLRFAYHALRGEIGLAETYRLKVERHAVQAGRIWQNEVWAPSFFILVYTSTLDTSGLKRIAERLDQLAQEIPSLRYDATMVRAEYHHAKGDHEQGFAISKPILDSTQDRAFIGRSNAMATFCRGLNQLGRHQEAKAVLLPLVERLTPSDRRVAAMYVNLERELAHAYAGLGDHDAAARVIDQALERYADSQHPLLLGNLYSTAATIAMTARDYTRAAAHARLMERWFRVTDNPVLIAQSEKMQRRVRALSGAPPEDKARTGAETTRTQDTARWQTAMSELTMLREDHERAEHALRLAMEQARSRGGFLFCVQDDKPLLIAPRQGEEPPDVLMTRVQTAAMGGTQLSDAKGPEDAESTRVESLASSGSDAEYAVFALEGDDGDNVVGVLALLIHPARAFRAPKPEFLDALARALFPRVSTLTREEVVERGRT